MVKGKRNTVGFLARLMDWFGEELPTEVSIAGKKIVAQGEVHVKTISESEGKLRGHRSLVLDGLGLKLTNHQEAELQDYFDSLDVAPGDPFNYSQLGGEPYWIQCSRTGDCPNPLCSGRVKTKHLAHICPRDTPGLGDSDAYFDYQFMICPACRSIIGQYEFT